MKINITQEDIAAGTTARPSDCAIAQSFKRIMANNNLEISVFYSILKLNGVTYKMPQSGTDFVAQFDMDKNSCNPTIIDIPDLVLI